MMMSFLDHQEACTAIFGACLIIIFLIFLYFRSTPEKKIGPPEAGGAWPIIGHLHLLRGSSSQLPHMILGELADKYGPIFTIRLGVHRAVVVSGSEVAKELFTTHDVVSCSRPKFLAAKHLGYNYAMFGFTQYGPYWRELRKIASLELLSKRRLELLKHVRVSETKNSITELYNFWKDHHEKKENGDAHYNHHVTVDMKKWFGDLTSNVILRMVVGRRYFSAANDVSADDEDEARRCQEVMKEFFRLLGTFVISDMIPFLRCLDIGGYETAMKETFMELDGVMEGWLQEHRQKKDNTGSKGTRSSSDGQDFMDVMLQIVEGASLGGYDPDTVVKATCLNMISSGIDTIAVMLIWALSLLLNNRHALRKAQEELETQVGKNRQVDELDISKLVYLQAIVKETLRLYPAGPLSGPREFTEDCTVGGYHIPKGTRLVTNIWKLQRDPLVWPDPSEFKPERFFSQVTDIKGQQFELIPFGAGRRICPALAFTLEMMHMVLASFLHAFEISTPDEDAPVDMTESPGLTNSKTTPLDILIHPRLSPTLYY